MTHDEAIQHVDDYVDGLLEPAAREAFEVCLKQSEALRAEVEALNMLKRETSQLPDNIMPERDLWPDIQSRIESRPSIIDFSRFRGRRPRYSVLGYAAAMAALVLIAFGAGIMLQTQPTPTPSQTQVAVPPAEINRIEAQYATARDELRVILDERGDRLAPETLAVVEENLAIIEDAVTGINLALANDPGSEKLEHMLHVAYRSEVNLLQQAVQLTQQDTQPDDETNSV